MVLRKWLSFVMAGLVVWAGACSTLGQPPIELPPPPPAATIEAPQPQPVAIAADVQYLQQALKHIFDNAVHYTPAGGTITLNTRVENQAAVIEIRDTGIGIAPDDLLHIFDRYYKANKARTHNESGVGIGLTMAKKIIEGHSGSITAESVVNQGSLFRVMLPLAAETLAVR